MIFKKLILFFTLLAASSCSEFLKGVPAKEMAIEIKQEQMSCLKEVSLEMTKFMKSETTNDKIDKTFECIDSTLAQFMTRVEGREAADSFTSEELYQIFDKFLKDAKISKAASHDLMELKSAMLGGSDQKISKTEILALRDFLKLVRTEAKNLLPYSRLLSFAKSDVPFSKNMIRSAFSQLSLSLKNLLKASKFSRSTYRYEDLKSMMLNLKLIEADQSGLLELAEKVNDLIIGRQSISTEADRELYIDNLSEVLRLYYVQKEGFIKFEISSIEVLDTTLEYISDVVALLENSVQYKKSKLIAVESLDPLISEIQRKDILPLKLSSDTALSFYKTLLVRVFNTGLKSDIKAFKGLEPVHFVNIRRELSLYRVFSRLIAGLKITDRLDLNSLQKKIHGFDLTDQSDLLKDMTTDGRRELDQVATEIKNELLRTTPVIYRSKKVVLAVNQEIWNQSWEDIARTFYVLMISRELIAGWGENGSIGEQGIVQWYSEFKAFGLETGSFDPRTANAGLATLRAANLFTRSGNGDNKMDLRETTEQLSILFTSGGETFRQLSVGLQKANCNLSENDVFGKPWNNEACVKNELRRNYRIYFSNMSYLVSYMNSLNDAQFFDFYSAMMDVARTDAKNREVRLESSDLKTMTILFHYVESLFAGYDKNRNLKLSEEEIKAAYPKFKVFAEDYARKTSASSLNTFSGWIPQHAGYGCYTENDLIKDGFVYLVLNARNAGLTDLNIAPCLINKRPLMSLDGEVDRRGLINTFKLLKAVLGS